MDATAQPAKETGAAQSAPSGSGNSQTAATGQKPAGPPPREPQWTDFFSSPLFLIIIGVWVWVFFSTRKQKQKEAKRKEELDAIKKGDKVMTIGRMHGVVVGLTPETMTIKPDSKSATTITFDRVALLKKIVPGENKDNAEK